MRTLLASEMESPGNPATRVSSSSAPRKTKMILTLGPALESAAALRGVLEAGVSVFRLNLALIHRDAALKAVYAIRSISTELQRPVALLLEISAAIARADAAALTENELADLRFGLECGVDWIAVPAGRDGNLIRQSRQFLSEAKRGYIGVLARVDSGATSAELDGWLADADGFLLVSANNSANQVAVQKCVSARKPAVIPVNGQGEVSNALSAQPDALLFTEVGGSNATPPESVRAFDNLIRQLEASHAVAAADVPAPTTGAEAAIIGAMKQTAEAPAEALVLLSRSGQAAIRCAAWRPRTARVVVFTPDARLARLLRLHYALESVVLPFGARTQSSFVAAEKLLRERGLVTRGAKAVFLSDSADSDSDTDPIPAQIRTIS